MLQLPSPKVAAKTQLLLLCKGAHARSSCPSRLSFITVIIQTYGSWLSEKQSCTKILRSACDYVKNIWNDLRKIITWKIAIQLTSVGLAPPCPNYTQPITCLVVYTRKEENSWFILHILVNSSFYSLISCWFWYFKLKAYSVIILKIYVPL